MSLLLIIAIIWGASALIRASKEAKRQREAERQRKEAAARSAELARMTAEWKQRQAEAKAETARLIALEREQMRQAKEQERQAKALEKEEKERKAADEKLAKAIFALNKKLESACFRIEKAEEEIIRFRSVLESLKKDKKDGEKELEDVQHKLTLIDDWSCIDPRTDKGMAFAKKYNDSDKFAKARDEYEKLIGFDKKGNLLDPAKAQEKLEKRKAAIVKKLNTIDNQIFTADQKVKKAYHDKLSAQMDKAYCEKQIEAA